MSTTMSVPQHSQQRRIQTVQILFATDPICSHCWAMEPAWRRFLFHYADQVKVTHLYGGLLPGWDGFRDSAGIRTPTDIPPHWAEVAERYGQPIDGSVWLSDPLDSSYPASVATHAVRTIAPAREEDYLRRLRQALFLEARNIARPEVLLACATDIGLDATAFAAALRDPASAEAFAEDLSMKQRDGIRGFPTLVITGVGSDQPWVLRGSQPFFRLERALEVALGTLPPRREVSAQAVLEAYGTGTTREFSEVLELDAEATETALAAAGARSRALAGSQLWSVA